MGEWAEKDAEEFDAIAPAVEWIKNHREEILVGTVIVIAGVAFAAAVAAWGSYPGAGGAAGGRLLWGVPNDTVREASSVKIFETFANAAQFSRSQQRSAMSAGHTAEGELWRYLRETTDFIHQLGQAYCFEDYLQEVPSTAPPYVSAALDSRQEATSRRAMALALKGLAETHDSEQARHARVLVNLLNFLADTGQIDDFEDFFTHRLDYAPLAMASFATRDEAEAWLKGAKKPPSPACILIGDEYYLAWYSREDGSQDVTRDFTIEPYIEELTARGIPPGSPAFTGREEAEAWLATHPASPFVFLSIEGEYYFAVHHKRLKRHTLHPVALSLREWEEEKRAAH
ncbi:hypothetical protein POL68_26830 [Stigmatella sp. ncwal1]|uniref:Uncharacterized protein n=1 Tax=Stigmatella ashevillensis TaxID=2995309 RepID=A0ABT5DEL8_9BACT|nr:hypothetical protein [Stigmatella ashevillena]MDC0712110.1 hypothetical protein [Stigmatella ashevillena]